MNEISMERLKAHHEWRERIALELPDLAKRVFQLRCGGWAGCGFHYEMERSFGMLVARINNYNDPIEAHTPLVEQVHYESLIENLMKAEWSLQHGGAFPSEEGAPWHVDNQEKIEKAIKMIEALAAGIENSKDESMIEMREMLADLPKDQFDEWMDAAFPKFLKEFVEHYVGHNAKDDLAMMGVVALKYHPDTVWKRTSLETAMLVTAYGSTTLFDKLRGVQQSQRAMRS